MKVFLARSRGGACSWRSVHSGFSMSEPLVLDKPWPSRHIPLASPLVKRALQLSLLQHHMPRSKLIWMVLCVYAACVATTCKAQFHPAHSLQLVAGSVLRQSRSMIDAWGGSPPAACATASPDTLVTWDPNSNPPRCVPDVCGGAVLTDLKDADGKVSVAQICAGPLFDAKRTKACLHDRPVLFLGDSTMHVSHRNNLQQFKKEN